MDYSASDTDVDDYIAALQPLVVQIGTNAYSGTANLKELCTVLQDKLAKLKLRVNDKRLLVSKRLLIVSKQITSISSAYAEDNMEHKYSKYLPQRREVGVDSSFMKLLNLQMDDNFGRDFRELSRLRREKQELGRIQNSLALATTFLEDLDTEITELIGKLPS